MNDTEHPLVTIITTVETAAAAELRVATPVEISNAIRRAWLNGELFAENLDAGAVFRCELCHHGIGPDAELKRDDSGDYHLACLIAYDEAQAALALATMPGPAGYLRALGSLAADPIESVIDRADNARKDLT